MDAFAASSKGVCLMAEFDVGRSDNVKTFVFDVKGVPYSIENVTFLEHEYNTYTDESTFTFTTVGNPLRKFDGVPGSKAGVFRDHMPTKVYVNNGNTTCVWKDGSRTTAVLGEGDEFDLETGVMVCAVKKWMPGGTNWLRVLEEIGKRGVEVVDNTRGHDSKKSKKHSPVDHSNPGRPYMRGGRYGRDERQNVIDLVNSGYMQKDVSRMTGISQATISTWMKEYREQND